MKNLISIKDLGEAGINEVLHLAESEMIKFANEEEIYPYRGHWESDSNSKLPSVHALFLEKSLRTWGSFRSAADLLGFNFRAILGEEQTSIPKNESFGNTVKMLVYQQAADILVVRTRWEGAPRFAVEVIGRWKPNASVINAGDGSNYHPSQTLLDLLAIKQKLGRLENFTLALCGDIKHSRVAHGLLDAARIFGFQIGIFSDPFMGPPSHWLKGVDIAFESDSPQELRQCDIIYVFRPQLERVTDPNERQRLVARFQITPDFLDTYCKPDVIVMHAQPVDQDHDPIRIYPGIDKEPRIRNIHHQAWCGLPARMAILWLVYQDRGKIESEPSLKLEPEVIKDVSAADSLQQKKAKVFRPIKRGTIIDGLPAQCGIVINTSLEKLGFSVKRSVMAVGIESQKMGQKDVLVLEDTFLPNQVMASITLLAPQARFNVIRDSRLRKLQMPTGLSNVPAAFNCPNPLCITNNDRECQPRFSVEEDEKQRSLVCTLCERVFTVKEVLDNIKSRSLA